MAFSIYSPTYAADSPYIRGTIRDDPRFLLAGAVIWAVRFIQPTFPSPSAYVFLVLVLRDFELLYAHHPTEPAAC
jgi:hypothetical protein